MQKCSDFNEIASVQRPMGVRHLHETKLLIKSLGAVLQLFRFFLRGTFRSSRRLKNDQPSGGVPLDCSFGGRRAGY